MDEVYFSIDVEADGPCPGLNSMLSLGIAIFEQGTLTGTFSRNLLPLDGGVENPETMQWWKTQPQAWDICHRDQVEPSQAMRDAVAFCESFPAGLRRVPVAWPASFDWAYLNYYFWRFAGNNPLGFACMDLRSYIAGLNGHVGYYSMPESDINRMVVKRLGLIDHEAVSDALSQGDLLVAALEYARGRNPVSGRRE